MICAADDAVWRAGVVAGDDWAVWRDFVYRCADGPRRLASAWRWVRSAAGVIAMIMRGAVPGRAWADDRGSGGAAVRAVCEERSCMRSRRRMRR